MTGGKIEMLNGGKRKLLRATGMPGSAPLWGPWGLTGFMRNNVAQPVPPMLCSAYKKPGEVGQPNRVTFGLRFGVCFSIGFWARRFTVYHPNLLPDIGPVFMGKGCLFQGLYNLFKLLGMHVDSFNFSVTLPLPLCNRKFAHIFPVLSEHINRLGRYEFGRKIGSGSGSDAGRRYCIEPPVFRSPNSQSGVSDQEQRHGISEECPVVCLALLPLSNRPDCKLTLI